MKFDWCQVLVVIVAKSAPERKLSYLTENIRSDKVFTFFRYQWLPFLRMCLAGFR